MRGKEAGDAFDHHFAYVVLGFADERDAAHGPVGIFKITEREPLTHSAPARVLPAPRPPRMSQVVQGLPLPATAGGF